MKELTAHQLKTLTESIFVRFDWKGDFKVLRGFNGETFLTLNEAQEFCRTYFSPANVRWEISNYEQALMNNGMRDNL